MANMIRPEARKALLRWGETLAATAVVGLGLYWALGSFGFVQWVGWVVVVVGVAMLWSAVQRARFAARGDGPGVVQIVEGEIRYFGPRGGGFAAIDAIIALSLSADNAYWLVEADDGQILAIPRAAAGAEALFDTFASLPGLEMERLLRVLAQAHAPRAQIIWQRSMRDLLT